MQTTVQITDQMHQWIKQQISAGEYSDPNEIVGEALRLLKARQERDNLELAYLQKKVATGVDQADSGNFSSRSVRDIVSGV